MVKLSVEKRRSWEFDDEPKKHGRAWREMNHRKDRRQDRMAIRQGKIVDEEDEGGKDEV